VRWAADRSDIRAMLVTGSRARADTADEWSDLDIAFTTTEVDRYRNTTDWLDEIGDVWVGFAQPAHRADHGMPELERRGPPHHCVVFSGGVDANFFVLRHGGLRLVPLVLRARAKFPRVSRLLPGVVIAALDRQVWSNLWRPAAVRVLVDKEGSAASAIPVLPPIWPPAASPTAGEFRAVVLEFWHTAVWNAKHLRRGALWSAKTRACDGQMKVLLLRMIVWHAQAVDGAGYEAWEYGRHLEERAEGRVIEGLRASFAHYDEDDLWRASLATMDLFRTLATETAERLELPYPASADAAISEWVRWCEAGRARAQTDPDEG
jgi:aminoglycoside 6-adenylyltransferase